jgi:hypothetical protein
MEKCGAKFKILKVSSQILSPFPEQSSLSTAIKKRYSLQIANRPTSRRAGYKACNMHATQVAGEAW